MPMEDKELLIKILKDREDLSKRTPYINCIAEADKRANREKSFIEGFPFESYYFFDYKDYQGDYFDEREHYYFIYDEIDKWFEYEYDKELDVYYLKGVVDEPKWIRGLAIGFDSRRIVICSNAFKNADPDTICLGPNIVMVEANAFPSLKKVLNIKLFEGIDYIAPGAFSKYPNHVEIGNNVSKYGDEWKNIKKDQVLYCENKWYLNLHDRNVPKYMRYEDFQEMGFHYAARHGFVYVPVIFKDGELVIFEKIGYKDRNHAIQAMHYHLKQNGYSFEYVDDIFANDRWGDNQYKDKNGATVQLKLAAFYIDKKEEGYCVFADKLDMATVFNSYQEAYDFIASIYNDVKCIKQDDGWIITAEGMNQMHCYQIKALDSFALPKQEGESNAETFEKDGLVFAKDVDKIVLKKVNNDFDVIDLNQYNDLKIDEIGENAFENRSFRALFMQESILFIRENAFKDTKFDYIVFPDKTEFIAENIFDGAKPLNNNAFVKLPHDGGALTNQDNFGKKIDSKIKLFVDAESYDTGKWGYKIDGIFGLNYDSKNDLLYKVDEFINVLTVYNLFKGLDIPKEINGQPVKGLMSGCIYRLAKLNNNAFTIPEGITHIIYDYDTFLDLGAVDIKFPKSLIHVGGLNNDSTKIIVMPGTIKTYTATDGLVCFMDKNKVQTLRPNMRKAPFERVIEFCVDRDYKYFVFVNLETNALNAAIYDCKIHNQNLFPRSIRYHGQTIEVMGVINAI